jgi:hypothetical protein
MTPIIHADRTLPQLTEAEVLNPFPVIADLFRRYTLGELRELLYLLTDIVLAKDGAFSDPENRAAFLCIMNKLDGALQADYVIAKVHSQMPVFSD